MDLITKEIDKKITQTIIIPLLGAEYKKAEEEIIKIYTELYNKIPDGKKISYGNYTIVKMIGKAVYKKLEEKNTDIFNIAGIMFTQSDNSRCKGVFLVILSYLGLEDYKKVLPYFEEAAIRKASILYNVPCITTLSGALAACSGIEEGQKEKIKVKCIQEYHKQTKTYNETDYFNP